MTPEDGARGSRAAESIPQTAHPADKNPFRRGHRLHREARVLDQGHVLEARLRLDCGKGHRLRQRLDGLHVNRDEDTLLVGWIAIGFADDLYDTHHLLLIAGVIEEGKLAGL